MLSAICYLLGAGCGCWVLCQCVGRASWAGGCGCWYLLEQVNPGLTVKPAPQPHAAHMTPDERAAVRNAMRHRSLTSTTQPSSAGYMASPSSVGSPPGGRVPERPSGAKPSQLGAAPANKKRLGTLSLSVSEGAIGLQPNQTGE